VNKEYMAETLKRLRGNRTQLEVAKSIGITVSALSMYERGERVPRDEVKKNIAKFYGKSVHYIFFKE